MQPKWFIQDVVERVQRIRDGIGDDYGHGEIDWRLDDAIRAILRDLEDVRQVEADFRRIAELAAEERTRRVGGPTRWTSQALREPVRSS